MQLLSHPDPQVLVEVSAVLRGKKVVEWSQGEVFLDWESGMGLEQVPDGVGSTIEALAIS